MSLQRKLKYGLAINEAIHQMMEKDPNVILIGQGVKSPWYVGNTCLGLQERFGSDRIIDTPVSENAITGAAVGAAIVGMRPIVVHPRVDFMVYAMDPIINQAANWYYMNGGSNPVSAVFWGIVNRGGEQAAQHSQSLHATFANIPGLKVVMPATPRDAKGLLISAVYDSNPVVYLDDRWLYNKEGFVEEEIYEIPIGKGRVVREGKNITVVATAYAVVLVEEVADDLYREGIDIELIDIRTIKPLDTELIRNSIEKTGRLLVIDTGWKSFGISAEIIASVAEYSIKILKSSPERLTLPDIPAPASKELEVEYYLDSEKIAKNVRKMFL